MSKKNLLSIVFILIVVIIFLTSYANQAVNADLVSPFGLATLSLINPYALSYGSGNFYYNIFNPYSIYSSPYFTSNPYILGYTPDFSYLRWGFPYSYGFGSGLFGFYPSFY
ncbi:hypothetical protein JXL19_12095 [bacterium]|nr:hypothetical protein [bacterium]